MARNGGRARGLVSGMAGWTVAALAGVAAAVAAGTLPDVVKGAFGAGTAFLAALCGASAVMFAGINLWQQRRRGVGIVVAIPLAHWRAPWSPQWPEAAAAHARRRFDSCFQVSRAAEAVRPEDQAHEKKRKRRERAATLAIAHELVNARLMELSVADPSAPVGLYVNASLPDAFELGAKLKFNVHRELRAVSPPPNEDEAPVLERPVEVVQRSESRNGDFYPALRISGKLKQPLTAKERARAQRLVTVEPRTELTSDGKAVALVVHLADNPLMVEQAISAAAAGCADAAGRWYRCRAALVVDAGPANLPEGTPDIEVVVRHIYLTWGQWLRDNPELAGAPRRLFIAAPASIALALGWLMGHTTGAIPYPYDTTMP